LRELGGTRDWFSYTVFTRVNQSVIYFDPTNVILDNHHFSGYRAITEVSLNFKGGTHTFAA
jgi:hypothetical protein